ncbi:MAG: DUF4157 domain-containing protein [Nannocystaceae bacterium]
MKTSRRRGDARAVARDQARRRGDEGGGLSLRPPPAGVRLVDHEASSVVAFAPPVQREGRAAPRPGRPPTDSSGRPLPTELRATMERSFSADFSAVRVHEGESAPALGARAYTRGADIHFGPGLYQPRSPAGRELLGHELAHVVQQSQGRARATTTIAGVGVDPSPALEREAEMMGARAARGEPARTQGPAARASEGGAIQRDSVVQRDDEVTNLAYGHGAYMGMAMDLLKDEHWRGILEELMPDVYDAVLRDAEIVRSGGRDAAKARSRVVLAFENNPVCAAYGSWRVRSRDKDKTLGRTDRYESVRGLEWDVFLPKAQVLSFLGSSEHEEKKDLAREMVDTMMIAHGSGFQNAKEFVAESSAYDRVRGLEKARAGGLQMTDWMDLFGRALTLGALAPEDTALREDVVSDPRVTSDVGALRNTFDTKMPIDRVIALYRHIFPTSRFFSVILDVKTGAATAELLNYIVRELNGRGIHVHGIGSFKEKTNDEGQLLDQDTLPRPPDERPIYRPRQIHFEHGFGDVVYKNENLITREGDIYFFNGASLIEKVWSGGYRVKHKVLPVLAEVAKTVRLGIYVQENDIGSEAFATLMNFVNTHPRLLPEGFAWGGSPTFANDAVNGGDGWGSQRGVPLRKHLGHRTGARKTPRTTPSGPSSYTRVTEYAD